MKWKKIETYPDSNDIALFIEKNGDINLGAGFIDYDGIKVFYKTGTWEIDPICWIDLKELRDLKIEG